MSRGDGNNWYIYASNNPLRYTDPTGLYDYELTGEDWSLNIVRSFMEQSGHDDLMTKAGASRSRDAAGHSEAYSYVSDKAKIFDKALSDSGQSLSSFEKGDVLDFDDDFVNNLLGIDSQIIDKTSSNKVDDISPQGAAFIANYEKFESQIYLDAGGLPTIGFGHLIKPGEDYSTGITRSQGLSLFKEDISSKVKAVNDGLKVPVSQNQFDAITSFAFNVGRSAYLNSNFLASINRGAKSSTIEANLKAWKYVGKNVSQGLVNRRADEWELYSQGDYERNH